MRISEDTIRRLLKMYGKRQIGPTTVAISFVDGFLLSRSVDEAPGLFAILPPEIRQEVLDFLNELAKSGYVRRPILMGGPCTIPEEELKTNLMRLHQLVASVRV
jgi:hypothetical protein